MSGRDHTHQHLLAMGFDEATCTRASDLHPNDVEAAVAEATGGEPAFSLSPPEQPSVMVVPTNTPAGDMLGVACADDLLSNVNAGNDASNWDGPDNEELLEVEIEAHEAELINALRTYIPPSQFSLIQQQYQQSGDPLEASKMVQDSVREMGMDAEVATLINDAQSYFITLLQQGLPQQDENADGAMSPSCRTPIEERVEPMNAGSGAAAPAAGVAHGDPHPVLTEEDEVAIYNLLKKAGSLNKSFVTSVYLQCERNPEVALKIIQSQ